MDFMSQVTYVLDVTTHTVVYVATGRFASKLLALWEHASRVHK